MTTQRAIIHRISEKDQNQLKNLGNKRFSMIFAMQKEIATTANRLKIIGSKFEVISGIFIILFLGIHYRKKASFNQSEAFSIRYRGIHYSTVRFFRTTESRGTVYPPAFSCPEIPDN